MYTRMMQTTRRAMATIAVTALVLGMAGIAAAQPGPGGRGPGGRGPGGPDGVGGPMGGLFGLQVDALRGLDLTDAQRQQVRSIMESHREEARALAERGRTTMEALNAATQTATDENAIRQQGEALGAVLADAAVLRSRVRSEVWAVLTTEQQAKAEQLRAERENRMKERQQRMQQRMQERREKGGRPNA